MDSPPSHPTDVTSEYVQTHWSEIAGRARAGELVRVPAAGVAIVPLDHEEEAMRAWGRRDLARILAASHAPAPDLSEDEVLGLAVEEVRAHRAERAAKRRGDV